MRNTPVNIPAPLVQLGIKVVTVVAVIGVVYGILYLLATGL
jgi:hypothetical protein